MPDRLTPAQIRGARGMLNWSMADLAVAATLSISTIKRVERGGLQPVSDNIHSEIQAALEKAGIRFLRDEHQGIGMMLYPV